MTDKKKEDNIKSSDTQKKEVAHKADEKPIVAKKPGKSIKL